MCEWEVLEGEDQNGYTLNIKGTARRTWKVANRDGLEEGAVERC